MSTLPPQPWRGVSGEGGGGRSLLELGPRALPCLRARAPVHRIPGRPVLTAHPRLSLCLPLRASLPARFPACLASTSLFRESARSPAVPCWPAFRLGVQEGEMSGACSSYVSAEQEVVRGFSCPLPGGEAAAVFCCGFRDHKYCCDDPHSFFPYEHSYMWWLRYRP